MKYITRTRRDRKIYNRHLKGLSTYAIAQELGMQQPNVHRAIKRIKGKLNKQKEHEQYLIEMANKDVS
jgi:DNA-directed RNA polymerase specialized sigma24 family protein